MVKQGRTSDEEIQGKIQNIRAVMDGTLDPPPGMTRGKFLDESFWGLRRFADDLEARADYGVPEGDQSVATWPEKLRAVADECDRASEVYDTPRSESTLEERLYPGLNKG